MTDRNKHDRLTYLLLAVYLITIVWILIFKLGVHFSYLGMTRSVNLNPYRAPVILNGRTDFGEILLNVLVFIPLGLYAGVLYRSWSIGRKIMLFTLVSFIVEGVQLMLAVGAFDITDIINNTLGGITGLLLYLGIEKALKSHVKAQKLINVVALAGTVVVLLLLFLLKTNRLGITYQ
jgi:glycopeptide antibiotics resistance protein